VLGRLDDMIIIRGNNVFPAAIEGILREFREVAEFRIELDRRAALADLSIEIEPDPGANLGGLAERIVAAFRDRLHFRPNVRLVAAGSLPRFELKARRVVYRDRDGS
jgi:phenylacetate-CoA ligase